MNRHLVILFFILAASFRVHAQQRPYAADVATTAMKLWKDSFALPGDKVAKWRYDQGVILKGIEGLWNRTGDGNWFRYIQKSMDFYVADNGTIRGYKPDEYNIDHINNGKMLLLLYRVTGKDKYRKAAALLRSQLLTHPRTSQGGFWHKKIYPHQMWLDGLYMGQPFYAEYASVFGEDTAFSDITRQFVLMERYARDPSTGLLYHGWDESRDQQWADKITGRSPHVWGRALGWYGMAMVDALDHFPLQHPGRDSIIAILNRFATSVVSVQDPATGLWYDIPNMINTPRNYPEASASAMLVYTLAKAVRMGYLPESFRSQALKGYAGITEKFVRDENGQVNLHGTVSVSGLGGKPYRDGSFEYYMSEPVIVNDPKGMGAFINAANEIEMIPALEKGKDKTVLLDYYFNNEWKKDATGRNIRWHYTWDDKSNGGFAMLGDIFSSFGVQREFLETEPTAASLSGGDIYIIVDPDTEKETEKPNCVAASHARDVASWVKQGGVLLLMGNDAGNACLPSLNTIAEKFGIRFNEDNFNMVRSDSFPQGSVVVPAGQPVFTPSLQLFIKELATIEVKSPAAPLVRKDGKVIMAGARYGKGYVFAIGDPWLYNEYIDGRKLPAEYRNYQAAKELVQYLISQTPDK